MVIRNGEKTIAQIQQEGRDVRVEKLGPDDAIRFLRISESGGGDRTKDHKTILENDPDKLIKNIMARRKNAGPIHQSLFLPDPA